MNCMSQQINELMTALAKAQAKIGPAFKNRSNPFHKSAYADLDSIWAACRESLAENGLAVVQTINHLNGDMMLITILGHSSGQWIKSEMPIKFRTGEKINEQQALGSALTYYRRYALASIAGVATSDDKQEPGVDDDDDGEAASPKGNIASAPAKASTPISKAQHDELIEILGHCDENFNKYVQNTLKSPPHNAKSLAEMPAAIYEKVKSMAINNAKQNTKN